MFEETTGAVTVGHRADLMYRFMNNIRGRFYSCKGAAITLSSCDPSSPFGLSPESRLEMPQLLCPNKGRKEKHGIRIRFQSLSRFQT